jgi:hypothetical protein
MVLPRTILVHIPAGTQRSNRKYGNHPSETDAEAKRSARCTASTALGQPGLMSLPEYRELK